MTAHALPRNVSAMGTPDTIDHVAADDSGPEGMFVGVRMQELAAELGLNQRQLALRLGLDPRHFNQIYQNKRPVGLSLILKIARNSGRSIAWVCGEEVARPQIGTANAQGHVTMEDQSKIVPGTVYFAEATEAFPAGERVLVDPSDAWAAGRWLLIRPKTGGSPFFGWAFIAGEMRMLERPDRELIGFQADRHEVIGVIVGTITPPLGRPSAHR